MAVWSVSWPLTSTFADVSGSDVLGADAVNVGNPYAGWGGADTTKLLVQSGSTSINTARYLEFALTSAVGDITPETFSFSTKRRVSADALWQVRSSADGYTAVLASGTAGSAQTDPVVDLTGLGDVAGLTIRLYLAAASNASAGVYVWSVVAAGDTPFVGHAITPSGIASTLLVGSPAFSLTIPAKVLSPYGIPSSTSVGVPYVFEPNPDPVEWVPLPDADDVLAFLGWPSSTGVQVQAHVDVITALAREYTRRNAFGIGIVRAGVRAVIVAASARLVANPEQHSRRIGSLRQAPGFEGWSLAERAVLNDYRKVAR